MEAQLDGNCGSGLLQEMAKITYKILQSKSLTAKLNETPNYYKYANDTLKSHSALHILKSPLDTVKYPLLELW